MIRILVPVNFSDYAINALDYAITLGGEIPSEITLAHCFPEIFDEEDIEIPEGTTDIGKIIQQKRESEKKAFEEILEKTQANLNENQKKNISLKIHFDIGYAEDVLLKLSNELKPDVIVMGTKSKGETIKELLGSVTSDVVRKANVPVLTIPAESNINLNRINNILFITDFSGTDYKSLHKLILLIAPFKTVIHCVKVNASTPDKWDKEKMNEFREYCSETYRNHKVETEILYGENFIDTLDKFILDNSIDIIAMTRKKRNIISSLFHPGITRKILFHTNIPLLVFHT
jgi:nucleotide-binding universal stress UspA family protein